MIATVDRSELARMIGIDRSTLRRWEKAGRVPSPDLQTPGGRDLYSDRLAAAIVRHLTEPAGIRYRLRRSIVDALDSIDSEGMGPEYLPDTLTDQLLDDDSIAII